MAVSLRKARDYIYANSRLVERAIFDYLFENGLLNRVHQCLLCYKNPDGGWAHGLEHDIKSPESNPLQLEYVLSLLRDIAIPGGNLLEGSVAWVENNRNEDGSLRNPDKLLDYPHAPWWSEGGQTAPDSITGNLIKHGVCSPSLAESTKRWVQQNLTLEKIAANEWLFMAYHAFDYFMNVSDFPDLEQYKEATIRNIIECAEKAPEKQYYVLFSYAPAPESELAQHLPAHIIRRNLDYLAETQREDGGWDDEHALDYWQPSITNQVLLALRNYGRLQAISQ